MKRGPLIGFMAWFTLIGVVSMFVSDTTWSRGIGDALLLASTIVILGLIAWERRLIAADRQRRGD